MFEWEYQTGQPVSHPMKNKRQDMRGNKFSHCTVDLFLKKEKKKKICDILLIMKQENQTKYLVEQTPTRFVMKNKVLLFKLKHVQLYYFLTYMK